MVLGKCEAECSVSCVNKSPYVQAGKRMELL